MGLKALLIFNFYNERFPSVYFRVFVTFSCFLNNFFCFVFFSSIFGNICSFFRFKPQNFQINTRNNDIKISQQHTTTSISHIGLTQQTPPTHNTPHTPPVYQTLTHQSFKRNNTHKRRFRSAANFKNGKDKSDRRQQRRRPNPNTHQLQF